MQKRGLLTFLTIFILLLSIFPAIAQDVQPASQQDESQLQDGQENNFDDNQENNLDNDESEDNEQETDFDEDEDFKSDEDDLEELIEEAETFDEELTKSAGITPDSPIYFVEDQILTRFRGDLENREKKVAEMREMAEACSQGDQNACKGLETAFEKYKSHAEEFEREVSPEEREEAERSSKAIRSAIVEIAQNAPPTLKDELIREVVIQERDITTAAAIAEKIADLCRELSELDPGQFHRVCKTKEDSPKWQKNLFDDLTAEQEKEARLFFDVLSQCMRTEGRNCDCERIPHRAFAEMCTTVAPLATDCNEGNEAACDKMDEETENMFEILADAPHLQRVLKKLDDFEEERFDNHMPRECQEAGISPNNRNARIECMKIMIERGEEIPDECRPALREAINRGITNEREFRKICEDIMFELNAPEECINAGIKDYRECGRFMFQQNAPQECIDSGLTGESPRDHRKCEEIMKQFEGDRSGSNRGPGRGHGFNCRNIPNPEERLRCYDGALSGTRDFEERFRETKERERQCATSCREQGGAWDFSGGECECRFPEHNEDEFRERREFRNDEERFREEFRAREGEFEGRERFEGQFSPPPENFVPPENQPPEQTSPEPQPETTPEPTPEPEPSPVTGGVIINNPFLRYYFR